MKRLLIATMTVAAIAGSQPAFAAERSVKLSVPGMYCASCPYMVKKAVSNVNGVSDVSTRLEDRSATVTFDDALTSIDALRRATADIGYPSTVVGTGRS